MLSFKKKDYHLFFLLFCLFLLAHALVMFSKFSFPLNKTIVSPSVESKVMKIKFLRTKHQIVQSEESDLEEISENAFLSDKDRSFKRQNRAMNGLTFSSGSGKDGSREGRAQNLKLRDLSGGDGEHPLFKAARAYFLKSVDSGDKTTPNHHVSSTSDYLESIPLGDMTALNTVEYKYYGFYHRIRQKLEQFWGRSVREKAQLLEKARRRIASDHEMMTALEITLNHRGKILTIKITGSSGIRELDDAAVEAFHQAGPFPNPPQGLIVNGKVQLEWGFVVKT